MFHPISDLPSQAYAQAPLRHVSVLGSTGCIGTNALAVMAAHRERFSVVALAGGNNAALLAEQAIFWRPAYLAVLDALTRQDLLTRLPKEYHPEVLVGPEGYAQLASLPEVDTVLSAQVGAAGLRGTEAAARAGKVIALANKESLVLAGELIREHCKRSGAVILPVDSEHNAIFQCLWGQDTRSLRRLVLTASGGPFRGKDKAFLASVTAQQALRHPNWSMGAKISIDSATLMNKGLEVIEAYHLYGVALDAIAVVVHPQSIVHSLVEYNDGSMLAQLGAPDVRMPIAYCLCWPQRVDCGIAPLDLTALGTLSFEEVDAATFPCLAYARQAQAAGGSAPVILNAANEVAVAAFLDGHCGFLQIPELIDAALQTVPAAPVATLEEILALDAITREQVQGALQKL